MGLKNRAMHMMLANPHLAPFVLVSPPEHKQDWILIDHLMVIFKVKPSDYIEDEPKVSIVNMARTLASHYSAENTEAERVVLVKDGQGAQKPAVRDERVRYRPLPHIEFCKRHLSAIEYTMMKLLCDMGMKNKLFLVTGANSGYSDDTRKGYETPDVHEGGGVNDDIVVSFHEAYLEYKSRESQDVVMHGTCEDCVLSYADPRYADGKMYRPKGLQGVFLTTFADPGNVSVATLREACLRCSSTEADMLLIELGNILGGHVTVSSGDSDIIATLTACGREGITLRMNNMSYDTNREMHTSPFGELLFDCPEKRTVIPQHSELASSADRFHALCDIAERDNYLAQRTRDLHEEWERILCEQTSATQVSLQAMARYLHLGGIRGSIYNRFLTRLFDLPKTEMLHVVNRVTLAVYADNSETRSRTVFDYIFRALCPSPKVHRKRKLDCLAYEDEEAEARGADAPRSHGHISHLDKPTTSDLGALGRLNKLYMHAMVPERSYGRFLRLIRSGPHFHMRVTDEVLNDRTVQRSFLFFMILCGTDYNQRFPGLGPKKLMSAALNAHFPLWCKKVERLWYAGSPGGRDYHVAGLQLGRLTKMPKGTLAKGWTRDRCTAILKNMKYVYELWTLKHPNPGPEYGLAVRRGVVYFETVTSELDACDLDV